MQIEWNDRMALAWWLSAIAMAIVLVVAVFPPP
jgi:hypothetical protein